MASTSSSTLCSISSRYSTAFLLISFLCTSILFGQTTKCVFIPEVPDENQPPQSGRSNWCTPMAAANLAGYWDFSHCTPRSVDVLNTWIVKEAADFIGWFMDTGDWGSPFRFNPLPGSGTYIQDIVPGFWEFARWDQNNLFGYVAPATSKLGYDWIVQTDYTIGFDFHAAEIDSGRPTLITFQYWNLSPTGLWELDSASGDTIWIYDWSEMVDRTKNEDDPFETWNLEKGENGIGHTVTGVGYWRNFSPAGLPAGDWAVVHDNWSVTKKNVAIPWKNWSAVTKVAIPPVEIDAPYATTPVMDGFMSPGEYSDAHSLRFGDGADTTWIFYKVDGFQLYLAFDIANITATSTVHIYVDTHNNGGFAPEIDDFRISHTINNVASEIQGTGIGWLPTIPQGWLSSRTVFSQNWHAEIAISYAKLGITPGKADTIGISFWTTGTATGDHCWPLRARHIEVCSWGDLFSSDLFFPVELTGFQAQRTGRKGIVLTWETLSESNNLGFDIQRRIPEADFAKIGFAAGGGTTSTPRRYRFVDDEGSEKRCDYRLVQIDLDGSCHPSHIITVAPSLPERMTFYQNSPNPFNSSTRIGFDLERENTIEISIFNISGQKIRTLADGHFETGKHEVVWSGRSDSGEPVASGIYIYKIQSDSKTYTRKMILIR